MILKLQSRSLQNASAAFHLASLTPHVFTSLRYFLVPLSFFLGGLVRLLYSQLVVQGRAIRSRPLGYGGVARKSAKVGQGSKVARVPEKSADLSL